MIYGTDDFFFVILFYMFERLKKTTRALIYGRDGISPNVDKFMRDHGDEPAGIGVRKGYLLGNPSGYRRIHIRFYYLETDW